MGIGLAALLAVSAPNVFAQDASLPGPPSERDIPIALMVDATSGQILHERNADRRFIPASITKTMTAFVAFELMDAGKLAARQTFAIRPDTFEEWSGKGSTMFLPKDARPTVSELLLGIMTVSANDGSIVLAEGAAGSVDAWVAMMNAEARKVGMSNSHFGTPNGWPDGGKTFVTARDLTLLARAMIRRHPSQYRSYIGNPSFSYNGIAQNNRDPLLGRLTGADGIKTGFTNEAGNGFLGSVERNGRRLVFVVAGADEQSVRNAAARDYVEWAFAAFDDQLMFGAGTDVGQARVQNGAARAVSLRPASPIYVSVPKGADPQVTMRISYDGPIKAPVKAGDRVAVLELEVAGMPTSLIPLEAAEDVPVAGTLRRVWNGVAGWFS